MEEAKQTSPKDGVTLGFKRPAEDEADTDTKKRKHDCLLLHHYHAERQGEREEMQDMHVAVENYAKMYCNQHESIKRLAFYAVYDGHGGARAAQFCGKHFHAQLAEKLPKGSLQEVEKSIKKVYIDTYRVMDDCFLKEASKQKPTWKDGTTATTILVINNTLYIANLGDSKAMLCRYAEKQGKEVGVTLTKDHSPSDYDERVRIQKAGGVVRDGRVMGVLEVSRSVGDGPYKNHGVTCLPDVKRCQLTNNDRFFVVACDGLWKTFSNDDVVKFVNEALKDESVEASEFRSRRDMLRETAAQRLASEAVRRLSADNVTVLLVFIDQDSAE